MISVTKFIWRGIGVMMDRVFWYLLWVIEELELERQQGRSLRNRCFKVFLLGLDGGLPGNNQSQQRLEANHWPNHTQVLWINFPCNLVRTNEFADLALNQCDPSDQSCLESIQHVMADTEDLNGQYYSLFKNRLYYRKKILEIQYLFTRLTWPLINTLSLVWCKIKLFKMNLTPPVSRMQIMW